jgi:asparagine synthase (glutamine-hydrolysing)
MCGIAGIIAPFPAERLKAGALALANAQQHRGPDGSGVRVLSPVALAHRRLSIIDLEAGAQPLANEDDTVWITFNGEIYNYRELRRTLEQRGHRFRTRSDTEVIVHAYEEWGDRCVVHLRGMFAFAIADTRRQRVFLARDHFGIKPLVYLEQPGWFAFASELQAFHCLADARLDLDVRAIDEYLALQYIPAPRTIYQQVRKLPPGHTMAVDFDGRVHGAQRYWRPQFNPAAVRDENDWIEAFESTLRDSVRAHLISDVPVGAFLSGGLDSTAVVALAQEEMTTPVHTYSIGFRDPAHDESAWAAEAATRLGTVHRCEILEVDALEVLPTLVRHYGEPFGDSSAVATMAVAQLAAREVKTVLTGDGGDEGMAGYHSHLAWLRHVSQHGGAMLTRPPVEAWQQFIQYCDPGIRARLWAGDQRGRTLLPIESFEQAWAEARDLGAVQRVQYMDATTYLPYDILTKVDIASMAHSLETRTPLVDVQVWELLTQMPERLNIGADPQGQLGGKMMLKRFLSRYFPDRFVHRRKQGFGVPLSRWFAADGAARGLVDDRLLGSGSTLRTLFDPSPARELLRDGRHGPVWVLLVLEEWLRQSQARAGALPSLALAHAQVTVTLPAAAPAPITAVAPVTPAVANKPTLLIVADVPNWIFERHARTLQQALADEFEISVQYHTQPFDEAAWDLIYVMEFGLVPPERITMPWKYVTGVRSHVSWDQLAAPDLARFLMQHFQRTHVVSARLQRELAPWLPAVAYVTHGFDGTLFRPAPRVSNAGRPLRVGWAGNRTTAVKGFADFIEPLGRIEGVTLGFCGYSDRNLTRDEMVQWYRDVDVYVCASLSEGNNNALLEAAASGCAIVTTDNGTVPEYLEHSRSALIVPRTPQAFIDAVAQLRDDPTLQRQLGEAASAAVLPAWTWPARIDEHRAFFRDALASRRSARRRMAGGTPAGRRWISSMASQLERAVARGQSADAMALVTELLDSDPENTGFQQIRDILHAQSVRAA